MDKGKVFFVNSRTGHIGNDGLSPEQALPREADAMGKIWERLQQANGDDNDIAISSTSHPVVYPFWKRACLRIRYFFFCPKLSKGSFKKTQV